jgi:hypothetical protein
MMAKDVDFLELAEAIVRVSGGKIWIAYREADESHKYESEASHFLKGAIVDGEQGRRIGRDIEMYNLISSIFREADGEENAVEMFVREVISHLPFFGYDIYASAVKIMGEFGYKIHAQPRP